MLSKRFILLSILSRVMVTSVFGERAEECLEDNCHIEDDCRCSSTLGPLPTEDTPQLITLTFTERLDDSVFRQFWKPLLDGRKNPDGKPISATFFVPHEFSNYERVHELYVSGNEIAVQSVSDNQEKRYWRTATEETLTQEFGGQKQILSKFANIPAEHIRGVRTPIFQLSGNITFRAYVDSELSYDSSWPTGLTLPLFPYTLDFQTTQKCREGIFCPTESFESFWVFPITTIQGQYVECYNISECRFGGNFQTISEYLQREVNKTRNGNRQPMTIVLDSNWFINAVQDENWRGLNNFLDAALNYTDTFFVSHERALEWMRNPAPLGEFLSGGPPRSYDCDPVTCRLEKEGGEYRYMKSCVPCPEVYPWLNNPGGVRQPKE